MLPMSGPLRRRCAPIALPPILGLCLAAGTPAAAQVVISGQDRGEVVVNSEVLDALGPPQTPQLLDPSLEPVGRPGVPRAGAVPKSRVYALPPVAGAPPRPSAAPASALATSVAPATRPSPPAPRPAPVVASAPPPAPAMAPAAVAAPTPPPAPRPVPVVASAPPPALPPSPPARQAPRAAMASAPPPPPVIDTPPATPPPARPAAPPTAVASAVPPPAARTTDVLGSTQAAMVPGVLSRVLFTPGSADLNDAGRRELSHLADKIGRDGESRIQLLAYADGAPENESQARRLSLSRALAVRSFLIDQGIRSTRVNVQALGIRSTGGPADRVDAMAVQP